MPAQKKTASSLLGAVIGTLGFSILAGGLVTVMVAPAIAVTGITANNTIGIFESLPEYVELNGGSQPNVIQALNADGTAFPIATIFDQNREEVALDDISIHLQDAAVAGEDRRFYEHGGVDITSVLRAVVGQASGNDAGGASTLSMQTVRNIQVQSIFGDDQLTDDQKTEKIRIALDSTVDRKLKEMKLAIGLEKKYTKQEILQGYLNIAGFGGNTYGVQAAARQYFSKNAADLTIAESASLIAIVQEPSARDLKNPEHYAANQERRDVILSAMYTNGKITKAERDAALAIPVDANFVHYSTPQTGCLYATAAFQFACDYVTQSVFELDMLGSSVEERRANWKTGGYTVTISINPTLQTTGTAIAQQWAPKDEARFQLGAAISSVEVGTGRIITMAQNKDFNNTLEGAGPTATAVNFNTDLAHGGSVGFQPGSTYKPYVLLAFLSAGRGLGESFNAGKLSVPAASFADSCNGPNGGPPFKFKNDSGEKGSWTVQRATASSVNSVFVQMASKIDSCDIAKIAESIGVHNASGANDGTLFTNPSCSIGGCANNIAPITAAAAYAAIANQGVYCAPTIVDKIVDRDGNDLGGQQANCGQSLVSPAVANTAAFAMQGVFKGGTASASNPGDGTTYMGKTGTTDNAIHVWLVGSSTRVSTAVWVGNIVGEQSLRKISVAGTQAALLRHRIFKPMAQAVDAIYPGGAFAAPDPALMKGSPVFVPDLNGMTPEQAKAAVELAELTYVDGGQVDSDRPAGTVAAFSPGAGEAVSRGSDVTVYTSNGLAAAIPDVTGQSYGDAKTALQSAGFSQVVRQCAIKPLGDTTPDNQVLSSNPAAGSVVNKANVVTLNTYGVPGPCSS